MKYSFLIPYHDRLPQFERTVDGFAQLYAKRSDYELVVILDKKSSHQLADLLNLLWESKIPHRISPAFATTMNPAPHFNQAASAARGDFFLLTSPEVYHVVDILSDADHLFEQNSNAYLVCACESMTAEGRHHMWYQHSQLRNKRYHFCSILSRESWGKVGGFDEEYAAGIAYDDDDFLARVEKAQLEIVLRDDLLTRHQHHEKPYERTRQRKELVQKNRDLYFRKWGKELPI